jgi:hypothetical protein
VDGFCLSPLEQQQYAKNLPPPYEVASYSPPITSPGPLFVATTQIAIMIPGLVGGRYLSPTPPHRKLEDDGEEAVQ